MSIIKNEAKKAHDNLPEDASWDDVMYEMYVRKKIDDGINAADKGEVITHEDVKKKFLSR